MKDRRSDVEWVIMQRRSPCCPAVVRDKDKVRDKNKVSVISGASPRADLHIPAKHGLELASCDDLVMQPLAMKFEESVVKSLYKISIIKQI